MSRGSISRIGRQARPNANAIGTRRIIKPKNTPNSTMLASPGVRTAWSSAARRSSRLRRPRHFFAEEQHPGDAGERPGDEDVRSSAARRAPSAGTSRSARIRCPTRRTPARRPSTNSGTRSGSGALTRGPNARQDVDLEMRALADADHGAEHDHPDEEEASQFLGPDVGRDVVGDARHESCSVTGTTRIATVTTSSSVSTR